MWPDCLDPWRVFSFPSGKVSCCQQAAPLGRRGTRLILPRRAWLVDVVDRLALLQELRMHTLGHLVVKVCRQSVYRSFGSDRAWGVSFSSRTAKSLINGALRRCCSQQIDGEISTVIRGRMRPRIRRQSEGRRGGRYELLGLTSVCVSDAICA